MPIPPSLWVGEVEGLLVLFLLGMENMEFEGTLFFFSHTFETPFLLCLHVMTIVLFGSDFYFYFYFIYSIVTANRVLKNNVTGTIGTNRTIILVRRESNRDISIYTRDK